MSLQNYREEFFLESLDKYNTGPGKKLGVKYYDKHYVICAYLLKEGYILKLLDFENRKELDKKVQGDITQNILELLEEYHTTKEKLI